MIKINESVNKFHPFTRNDWYGFAGAISTPDGKYPQIAENDDGVTIIVCPEDEGSSKFVVNVLTPRNEARGGKIKVCSTEKQAMRIGRELIDSALTRVEDVIDSWK